jgi:hypothetical protein
MHDLPKIYKPGTIVVIHDKTNLDGLIAKVVDAVAFQGPDGNVTAFIYQVQLENRATVGVIDHQISPVEDNEAE